MAEVFAARNLNAAAANTVAQDFYSHGIGKAPHYFQQIAINRTIEAIAKGGKRDPPLRHLIAFELNILQTGLGNQFFQQTSIEPLRNPQARTTV